MMSCAAGSTDWPKAFRVAFLLSVVNLVYVACVLPESLPSEGRPHFTFDNLNPFAPLRFLARSRLVRTLAIILIPNTLGTAGMGDYLFYYFQTYSAFGSFLAAYPCASRVLVRCSALQDL